MLDRIRHDQGSQICDGKWPAEGGFSVTNLGNLDRIRDDQGWLAERVFSVTNLGNLDKIGAEGTHAPAGRSHVAEGHPWGPKAPQLAKRALSLIHI